VATRWGIGVGIGGTQTGDFLGIPASGRYASFTATTVDRVYDGKIIEHWADADFTAFLQNLPLKQGALEGLHGRLARLRAL
jgi:hypothetical protein